MSRIIQAHCFMVTGGCTHYATYSVVLSFTGLVWNRGCSLVCQTPCGTTPFSCSGSPKFSRFDASVQNWSHPFSMVPTSLWEWWDVCSWWKLLQGGPDCLVRKLYVFSRLEDLFSLSTYKPHYFNFPYTGFSQKWLLKPLSLILCHCGYFALFDPRVKCAQHACVHTQLLVVVLLLEW